MNRKVDRTAMMFKKTEYILCVLVQKDKNEKIFGKTLTRKGNFSIIIA